DGYRDSHDAKEKTMLKGHCFNPPPIRRREWPGKATACCRSYPLGDITGGLAVWPPQGRTRLCVCEPRVERGRPSPTCHAQPCGASVASPLPLLAQEVLQLMHELFRVKVLITPWARRLIIWRVIVLL